MAGILYYPFANAPLPILHQAVLYWDDLATVVAPGWERRLTPHMRELRESGLYRPVGPFLTYEPVDLMSMREEIAQAIDGVPLEDLTPPDDRGYTRGHSDILHAQKLDPAISKDLIRRGLVRETPGAPWRLVVSPTLLNIVVSIIANSIARSANAESGCSGRTGLRPHTDVLHAHRIGTSPMSGIDVTGCWQVDLSPLLPVPEGDVMIADVLDFRRRYESERARMMAAIDDLLHELSQTRRHPQDAFGRVKREMEQAVADLHGAARASKITWVVRPLSVTVALVASASASILPAEAAIPLSMSSTVGAIMVNLATSRVREKATGPANPTDYRYLHRVQGELGLTFPEPP
ncbi:DUF6236 family protein [Mangrovihabitans endophyticus]|uniref:Uncharacterized protein n=1 Tax=Mangrovihabitans endophyticus TaxID=1751298 RepID=A0A8J3C1R6_9ACTN|nr:DUF6236 family protein [Mangrovihabitans endophyticus]GGK95972.1 hypothetical protein GCM10012284_32700 [Mangrovihabitans endophyticus]